MNENEAKALENRKREFLDSRLELLDTYLEEWLSALEGGNTNFTEGEIRLLGTLAEKNLRNLSNKQGLNANQRKVKEAVRRRTRNSLADLERMSKYKFIGEGSDWNPKILGSDKDRLMFSNEQIKEDLPVLRLCALVQNLVGTYGDKYAIPLVDSIKQGLIDQERALEHDTWEMRYEVDVPIIRRTRSKSDGW